MLEKKSLLIIISIFSLTLSIISISIIDNDIITDDVFKSYIIEVNKDLLGEETLAGDETIKFLNDNTFSAYKGWGNSIHGTYSINDNIINCIITSSSGEYSPKQKTYAKLSFKILDNATLEIIEASETYKIKTTMLSDDGNWILTDEDKNMTLSPFIKGIKFHLEK